VRDGLGAFQGAVKQGDLTEFTFAGGKVTQDATGNVTVVRHPASA
jgi:hypothetical protein